MGKNWRGGKGRRGAGGGGGGANDVSSLRGNGCILATCEGARVRETNKEVLNLINHAIENIYPGLDEMDDDDDGENPPISAISDKTNAGITLCNSNQVSCNAFIFQVAYMAICIVISYCSSANMHL